MLTVMNEQHKHIHHKMHPVLIPDHSTVGLNSRLVSVLLWRRNRWEVIDVSLSWDRSSVSKRVTTSATKLKNEQKCGTDSLLCFLKLHVPAFDVVGSRSQCHIKLSREECFGTDGHLCSYLRAPGFRVSVISKINTVNITHQVVTWHSVIYYIRKCWGCIMKAVEPKFGHLKNISYIRINNNLCLLRIPPKHIFQTMQINYFDIKVVCLYSNSLSIVL